MKIEQSLVRKVMITGAPALDPIAVMLEDVAPGHGQITITCFGKSWTADWSAMGKQTVAQLFIDSHAEVLAPKLHTGLPRYVFDADGLIILCKQRILRQRRDRDLTSNETRSLFSEVQLCKDIASPWERAELMAQIFGEEWWHFMPEKQNPNYTYLVRVIEAVKVALSTLEAKVATAAA